MKSKRTAILLRKYVKPFIFSRIGCKANNAFISAKRTITSPFAPPAGIVSEEMRRYLERKSFIVWSRSSTATVVISDGSGVCSEIWINDASCASWMVKTCVWSMMVSLASSARLVLLISLVVAVL